MNCDRRHLHVVAGSRDAGQVTFVFAICGQAGHHLVAIGKLVLDLVITQQQGSAEALFLIHFFSPATLSASVRS
jgi:hypothetical protein